MATLFTSHEPKSTHMIRWSSVFILVTILSIVIGGCTFYRHYDTEYNPAFDFKGQSEWQKLDADNVLVVHLPDGSLRELYDLQYDEALKTFTCRHRAFEGKPLAYYNKVMEGFDDVALRNAGGKSRVAVRQIHFFLKDPLPMSEETVTFTQQDILGITAMKNASGLNFLASMGYTAVGFGIFLMIACNCPHAYIDAPEGQLLNNTMFTGAKAPQLERWDYKPVQDIYPEAGELQMYIRNEDEEDQFTNAVHLLAVLHAADVQVLTDQNGALHTIQDPRTPLKATDDAQQDILEKISTRDNNAYTFDQSVGNTLSTAALTFAIPAQQEQGKLVLRLKNTRWSGFVYNEFNALFGRNHDKWVEMNRDKPRAEREQWMRDQGIQLLVEQKRNGQWELVQSLELIGDLAYSELVVPLQLIQGNAEAEFRLRTGFNFWELDYAAMDYSVDQPVEVTTIRPRSAIGSSGLDHTVAVQEDDDQYMVSADAEKEMVITFDQLPVQPGMERSLFFASKGYYISHRTYSGKTERETLQQFYTPGALSAFSRELYYGVFTDR